MPSFMKAVHELFASFAKDKIRKRLILHPQGDLTKLHEDVGLDVLPAELGGTNGVIQDHKGNKHTLWGIFFVSYVLNYVQFI